MARRALMIARTWRTLACVAAAAVIALGAACGGEGADRPPRPATRAPTETRAFGPAVGFRTRVRLDEHHAKHGAEFGTITRDDYLRRAQALRDAPVGGAVLELRRDDGTVSRFDRASGGFVAFDADGIIRTYFRPNDGEAYFRRQARRRPDR
jgi:hypothetical protein